MPSSRRSSASLRALAPVAVAVALLALAGGCRHAPVAAASGTALATRGKALRVALLPPENLTGGTQPAGEVMPALELALAREGFEVVSGERVSEFLARHRIRWTGGVDSRTSKAAAEELEVDAIVVTSITLNVPTSPLALALTLRLVQAGNDPRLLWIGRSARTGDDSPGILALGVLTEPAPLRGRVLGPLAASLGAFTRGEAPRAAACEAGRRFRPRLSFRSPEAQFREGASVAVLPFLNDSKRRNASEVVALALVDQLAAVPGLAVLEPGAVREVLLRQRIIFESGVTLDAARQILGTLEADYVLAGRVYDFADGAGAGGSLVPRLNFSATLLDTRSGKILWQSTSYAQGDDGVWFFGLGTERTAQSMSCRMTRSMVEEMIGELAPRLGAAALRRVPFP